MNVDHERFGGIARLYGSAALGRLRAAHVCVVGVGGVGSWAVEGLARSGIGALTMIDLDDVCITNVNRQLPALDGQIGRPKAEVIADRVRLINPNCATRSVVEFFTDATAERLLTPHFDFIIDAIDKLSHKCLLIAAARARSIPILTVGAAGGRRDGTSTRVSDLAGATQDQLLKQVRKKLRRDYGFPRGVNSTFGVPCVYSPERPFYPWSDGTTCLTAEAGTELALDCSSGFGTAVFVTGAFGFAAAGEVVRRLALNEASA